MSHGERRLRERNRDRSGGVGGGWGQGGLKKQGLERIATGLPVSSDGGQSRQEHGRHHGENGDDDQKLDSGD